MGDELAAGNVNRSYSLAATSIAIFTFMLFFMYPRFVSGEINALLFQAALVVMSVATFSFVFAKGTADGAARIVLAYYPHQVHSQMVGGNREFRRNKGITLMRELADVAVFHGGVAVILKTGEIV